MNSLKRKIKYLFKPMPDPTSGIITGEKFQLLCDHYIGDKKDSSKNPLLWRKKSKWIHFEELNAPFDNDPRIFCYTHVLNNMNLLIEKIRWLKNPFLLVFHNSDHAFTEEHLKIFDSLPNLRKILSQNVNVFHDNITPLPIGVADSRFAHGNLSTLNRVRNQEVKKENLVYFNFNIQTNKKKRQECYQKISKKGIEFQSKKNFEDYIQSLSKHKYAICPEGNGIDTHRFWESLYLKVVPVCKKNPLVEYFSRDFPVILLNDWEDLDLSKLNKLYQTFSWENHPKLDISYYKKLLNGFQFDSFGEIKF